MLSQAVCHQGTVVATLLTPIGSYFNKSNQASYIGTSYLLSVCCFTPLYGKATILIKESIHGILNSFIGRLSDVLGRKGAMLLGLALFGMSLPSLDTANVTVF